jgi:NAD(P)-dependent dehydrogenase (short-subunit alcohol dehydrogenase family)
MPPSQAARVIGTGRGIGKQIALELARRHYRLAITYNEPPSNVEETVAAAVPRMLADSSWRMTGNSSTIL